MTGAFIQNVQAPFRWNKSTMNFNFPEQDGRRAGMHFTADGLAGHRGQDMLIEGDPPHEPGAFVILRRVLVRLDRDDKCQAADPQWPFAHLSTSLRMALGMQFSNRECSAACCGSDCRSNSVPATL